MVNAEMENEHIKVLVTGAFSTGKSTLIYDMYRHYLQNGTPCLLIGESARICPFPLNRLQSVATAAWLLGEQLRAEGEALQKGYKILFCDRGTPDILSHLRAIGYSQEKEKRIKSVLDEMCRAWISTYDIVLFSRVNTLHEIDEDGIRINDRRYQLELQNILEQIYAEQGTQFFLLPDDHFGRMQLSTSIIDDFVKTNQCGEKL